MMMRNVTNHGGWPARAAILLGLAFSGGPVRAGAAPEVLPLDVPALAVQPGVGPRTVAVDVDHEVNADVGGTWTEVDGWSTWRYSVSVPAAPSLGFHALANLPETARLRLLGPSGEVLRTYTPVNIARTGGQVWSILVPGDTLALELRVPGSDRPATRFVIDRISVGIQPSPLESRAEQPATSGNVQENWSCYRSSANELAGAATLMVTVQTTSTASGGTQAVTNQCTATLVNDVPQDGRLFILTAAHCAGEPQGVQPASLNAYWNAVSSCPAGLTSGQAAATAISSGATTRALFYAVGEPAGGDSWLLELSGTGLPPNSQAYYAGWDATDHFQTGNPFPAGVFNINHASGESRQYAATSAGPDSSGTRYPFVQYDWQVGLVVPGASGSGIFNAGQALLGTLTYSTNGSSTVGGSFFTLDAAWKGKDRAGDPATAVQPWLDPANTGTLTLVGRAAPPAPGISISVSPQSVAVGTAYTVRWSTTNATSCIASGPWSGTEPTSGTITTSQADSGTYNYVLTCSGPGGTAGDGAAVVVTRGSASSSGGGSSGSPAQGPGGGSGGGGAVEPAVGLGLVVAWLRRRRRTRRVPGGRPC